MCHLRSCGRVFVLLVTKVSKGHLGGKGKEKEQHPRSVWHCGGLWRELIGDMIRWGALSPCLTVSCRLSCARKRERERERWGGSKVKTKSSPVFRALLRCYFRALPSVCVFICVRVWNPRHVSYCHSRENTHLLHVLYGSICVWATEGKGEGIKGYARRHNE